MLTVTVITVCESRPLADLQCYAFQTCFLVEADIGVVKNIQGGVHFNLGQRKGVAHMIGWQLAVIGDELNRHHLNKPANPGLQCLLRATQAFTHTRGRIHRRLLAHWQMHRRRPGKMWAWLTSVRQRKSSRAECRGSWDSLRSAFPYSWAAGLLTAVLLTTAVAWISY